MIGEMMRHAFCFFSFRVLLVYRNSVFPSGATLREEVKRRSSGTKRAVERASLTKLRGDLNPGAEIQRALTAPHPRLLFRIPRLLFDARYPFFFFHPSSEQQQRLQHTGITTRTHTPGRARGHGMRHELEEEEDQNASNMASSFVGEGALLMVEGSPSSRG